MQVRELTKEIIRDAAPSAKRYVLWDASKKGFGLRVSPNGDKTYVVKARQGRGSFAEQRWITIGSATLVKLADAREEATTILAKARTNQEPAPRPHVTFEDSVTMSKLCDMWLEKAAHRRRGRGPLAGSLRKPEYVENDRGRIEAHIKPLLGRYKVREINRSKIETYRDAVSRGETKLTKKSKKLRGVTRVKGGEGTANRSLSLLSTILSFAVREEIIDRNPCFGVERSAGHMRERFLSPQEFGKLGEVIARAETEGANPHGIAIIRLLALSGARKSEIQNLTWGAVDLRTGFLRLPRSKTGPRLILITAAMRKIFEEMERRDDDSWVFPNADNTAPFDGVPKIWIGIRAAANLSDVRLHDLRHSAASFALMSGVGLEVIGKLLGHSDIKTTRRYAHLADVVVRAAAESTADQIAELMKFGEPAASEPPSSPPPAAPPPPPAARTAAPIRAAAAAFGARRAVARPDGRRPAATSSAQRSPGLGAPGGVVGGQLDMFEG
ncbi:MAG: tyrosine-type recombinase/integrase [Caulobacteraceae bacterium]